jgi:hypothetical protein
MNAYSILAEEFVEKVLIIAKRNLETDGYLAPVLFVRTESGEANLIPLRLPRTPDQKQLYFRALGSSLRHSGKLIQEALMLSESWFVQAKKSPEAWNIRLSQHPDRKEAITALGRNVDRSRYTSVVQPFDRTERDKLSWATPEVTLYNEPCGNGSFPIGMLDYLFSST